MTHRRILQEFAPAVVENVHEGDSFVEVLAKVTLDSVKRYVDGFPLPTSKKNPQGAWHLVLKVVFSMQRNFLSLFSPL